MNSIVQQINLLTIIDRFIKERIESGLLPKKADLARDSIKRKIKSLQS